MANGFAENTEVHVTDRSAIGTRVVVSPLLTLASVLIDVLGERPVGPWTAILRERARGLDPGPLAVFGPDAGMIPDGLLPLPLGTFPTFQEEMQALREAPTAPMIADLERSARTHPVAPALRSLPDDPGAWLARWCDALEAHWARLIAPDWPRIRRLLEREVVIVGRTVAARGLHGALADLHPRITFRDGALRYRTGLVVGDGRFLATTALTLMPVACEGDRILANEDYPDATVLAYPARGVAELGRPDGDVPDDDLVALLGATRARIARALDVPSTTTDLAERLGLAPSTISRHLSGLAGSGLVDRTRTGSLVFYNLSARGEGVIGLF